MVNYFYELTVSKLVRDWYTWLLCLIGAVLGGWRMLQFVIARRKPGMPPLESSDHVEAFFFGAIVYMSLIIVVGAGGLAGLVESWPLGWRRAAFTSLAVATMVFFELTL